LAKELVRHLPKAHKLVRGKLSLHSIVDELLTKGYSRLIIVYRKYGGPSQLELIKLENGRLKKIPPTIFLRNVRFGSKNKRSCRTKADCITLDSKEALPFAQSLSDFLDLPLVEFEKSDFNYSLHLTYDSKKYLNLMPISFTEKNFEGFVIQIKQLRW
jgi:rRNA maturation protein Rpf1